ncbi:MAG: ATP synthase F1 subunit delta, partial [Chitinophagales bacterium]
MRNPLAAYRYAKALVDLAVETNQLEVIKKDVDFLRANRNEEFNEVMNSPIVRWEKKSKVFKAVYHGRISDLSESFFDLVFSKGREYMIRDIGDAFDELYNEIKGIVKASITTPVPVSDELFKQLYDQVAALPRFKGKTLDLELKTDPRIIGGFILQIGDDKFDASVRNDLGFIKQTFIENLYK